MGGTTVRFAELYLPHLVRGLKKKYGLNQLVTKLTYDEIRDWMISDASDEGLFIDYKRFVENGVVNAFEMVDG